MEQKLNELKNQWCKFYCKYKNNPEEKAEASCPDKYTSGYCGECDRTILCECEVEPAGYYYPCDNCQIDNFVSHIIWELT